MPAAGLVAVAACLSGCAVASLSNPFKHNDATNVSDSAAPVTEDSLLANAQADTGSDISDAAGDAAHCPQVVAWPQDRVVTLYSPGHVGDSLSIVYRAELTKLARDCRMQGNYMIVRYGFAGRVLLGPKGRSGVVTLPISIRASGTDKKMISNTSLRVAASVPAGAPVGYFSQVKTLSFPIAIGTRPEDYKIYVALKRQG
jgi:hypothetical protein